MARGRRKNPESFEDEIALLDAQIDEASKKLQALKQKKRARIKEQEKNKDANTWEQIRNSGLSPEEILTMVNKNK